MYLAKHVGGWSTTQIRQFYNGHHNTTVRYAIKKIEYLRKRDGRVDALLEVLNADLCPPATPNSPSRLRNWSNSFLDALAGEVLLRLTSSEALPEKEERRAE
jgi:hypothetical protein